LAVAVFSLLAVSVAGGVVLGASSAETQVMQLVATCLSCGERWVFTPSATVGTGLLSLLLRRRKQPDTCPKCGSRAVAFAHPGHADGTGAR
jgi:hypothetical protein